MPTATTTATATTTTPRFPSKMSLSSSPKGPGSTPAKGSRNFDSKATSAEATLKSLYNRAARSFLQRELVLTESLIHSAFSLLPPPTSSPDDALSSHRKKWDILRITLETTTFASPPQNNTDLPPGLRANLTRTPHSLLSSIYNRSLQLFTSHSSPQNPDPAYLPSQILKTLVFSAIKLHVPEMGRDMIEDWLARRGHVEEMLEDREGYENVLELFCCEVLPMLDQWDYAKEFLEYESQMSQETRERMKFTLQSLYSQHLKSLRPPSPEHPVFARPATPPIIARTPSPASSTSSSSLSTTSTHTVVPRTPRPSGSYSPTRSVSSSSSTGTVTARTSKKPNGHANGSARTRSPRHSSTPLQQPSPSPSLQLPQTTESPPTFFALVRAFVGPYLTTSRLTTALLLFVVFPLVSILLHLRRRRRLRQLASAASQSAVVSVQRKLAVARDRRWFGRLWEEAVRAVVDTVRMGGVGFA